MNNLIYQDEDGSVIIESDCIDGCNIRLETKEEVDEFINDLKSIRNWF